MTRGVIRVAPGDTVAEARATFRRHDIHHLPVLDNGKVIGILTYLQLNKRNDRELVRDIMSRDVPVVDPETTLRKAAALMLNGTSGCLPVMEGEQLAGIITTSDLRRAVSGEATLR
ncbi:MAG TPA: CBS domain-containing protein [Thermoanaerobaculia bacterium]|nr:CBS domain-containing protein [Thermoanaerobaculia bacterium]